MCKDFQQLHSFLDGGNRVKPRIDDVLYHHLQVLHPSLELVVVVVPGAGLDIQDALLDGLQAREVLLEGVPDLPQAPGQLGTAAARERRHGVLLAFVAP